MSSVFSNCNSWPSDVTAPNGLSHSAGTRTNSSPDGSVDPETWTSDRYEIREEIGRGGGGIVLQAWDKLLEREVVIKKILDPKSITARARFQREAKITASLVHPGIVPVHELGIDPSSGCPYYAMQRVAGQTLDRLLEEKHSLPEVWSKILTRDC